ncbi:hypothetical protein [Sphingomonas astaxanthinifaciens]|uniref:Uncharacterized protein n=1 Tax=Sphingomonas astaxanthinifaciens DSM 22298 TaxID=1123267 RepID=A0ABQ5Z7F9_9SPHN|nr:hypothetical protein [Sphingomonas astaxanthinifaciens]GLR46522.1 hypothetical protein GCM10007925_02330 [Sphingomonas astaxanthinifaciens DSM 22298]
MGYRQTTNYDPLFVTAKTRPKRPFNWVQWIGVGGEIAAVGILLWHLLVRLEALHARDIPVQYGTLAALVGMTLINSRKEDVPEVEDDLQKKRNRSFLTATLVFLGLLALVAVGVDLVA